MLRRVGGPVLNSLMVMGATAGYPHLRHDRDTR